MDLPTIEERIMFSPPAASSFLRRHVSVVVACAVGFAAGALLTAGSGLTLATAQAIHDRAAPGAKAPIQEVLHCPLSFSGVHLLKDLPEHAQVAYHYCKPINDDVSQCILYDGTGPDARLIGVEYLVSDALYQRMPSEEKAYWHDHRHEVDAGLLKSLTQSGAEAEKTVAAIRPLWGKVFHTWAVGKSYPIGPPRLFWSVTGEEPFVLAPGTKLPAELDDRRSKPGR
jgi:hypothetical protein